jgi:hypothetical protein
MNLIDLDTVFRGKTSRQRFWEKVDTTGECWVWTASTYRRMPYGRFQHRGAPVLAHRFSYAMHHGSITPGKFVLHHCDNPSCVRPAHLYEGDAHLNMQDALRRGRRDKPLKEACAHGHPYTPETTYTHPVRGYRVCRVCKSERKRRGSR